LCLHQNATAPLLAAFIRSICLNKFGKVEEKGHHDYDLDWLQKSLLSDDDWRQEVALWDIVSFRVKDSVIVQGLLDIVTTTLPIRRHAIAALSTLLPDELEAEIVSLTVRTFSQEQPEGDIDTLRQTMKTSTILQPILDGIQLLAKMTDRIIDYGDILLECLRDIRWYEVRSAAAMALRCLKQRTVNDAIVQSLLSSLQEEGNPKVRKEVATTIGELQIKEDFMINALKDIVFSDKDIAVRRRVILSLVQLNKEELSEEFKKRLQINCVKDWIYLIIGKRKNMWQLV